MPDIVLGGILGAAPVQQAPHLMFQRQRIAALSNDVVLMKDMTEEMTIVEPMKYLR
jgi:hypothetical protein